MTEMNSIRLSFRGQEFSIPANRAFEAGAAVEEIVTLSEIAQWGAAPKFFKLARAFGALLRLAGCKMPSVGSSATTALWPHGLPPRTV